DIHLGLNSTLTLLTSQLNTANIQVVKEYNATSDLECYPGKLNQVFMNILSNAIQAIQKNNLANERVITIKTSECDGNILISVKDTGVGISPNIKNKIFDPFFTTKEVGEGTGLGLSIVYSIIQTHHGKIEVESEEGKGTEFILTLPLVQQKVY
ncbi:MAG TPA: ATP-binding protein, partial [Cytophagaceae bacterium]